MLKRLLVILAVLITLVLIINPLGRYERSRIFYPSFEIETTPGHVRVPYEDVFLTTQDGVRINGWFVPASPLAPTLLFLHGNAGNISHRLTKILAFHQMGLNVLIIDYRGYGRSQGAPSEKGLIRDARAAYDYLLSREDVDPAKMIGYGESLGGAVVIDLAGQRPFAALIIDSTFTSLSDMAKIALPLYPRFLIQNRMDSLRKVKNLTIPKLFMHSPEDQLVPFEMGQRLFKAAAEPKEFLQISGGHNQVMGVSAQTFINGIKSFLIKVGLTPASSNLP